MERERELVVQTQTRGGLVGDVMPQSRFDGVFFVKFGVRGFSSSWKSSEHKLLGIRIGFAGEYQIRKTILPRVVS